MLQLFSKKNITNFVNPREGETKLGEKVQTVLSVDDIINTTAKFVIIGVPEDIGVKMNYGNGGAHTAFIPALKSFLNTQENQFIYGNEILVLGYLDYLDEVSNFDETDREKGDLLVKVGDHVLKGQALTRSSNPMAVPIHAPTSGIISAI